MNIRLTCMMQATMSACNQIERIICTGNVSLIILNTTYSFRFSIDLIII
jgi:hypothetical protein